ncbi:MAG: hypothetical protein ACI9FD_003329 [Gammaproteobacteria bacterium]|jgi:hypothetical protein
MRETIGNLTKTGWIRQLLPASMIGVIAGIDNITAALAMGALLFTGPLASGMGLGVGVAIGWCVSLTGRCTSQRRTEYGSTGAGNIHRYSSYCDRCNESEIIRRCRDQYSHGYCDYGCVQSRSRNAGYPAPPAQSRTCGFPASGSSVALAFVQG